MEINNLPYKKFKAMVTKLGKRTDENYFNNKGENKILPKRSHRAKVQN